MAVSTKTNVFSCGGQLLNPPMVSLFQSLGIMGFSKPFWGFASGGKAYYGTSPSSLKQAPSVPTLGLGGDPAGNLVCTGVGMYKALGSDGNPLILLVTATMVPVAHSSAYGLSYPSLGVSIVRFGESLPEGGDPEFVMDIAEEKAEYQTVLLECNYDHTQVSNRQINFFGLYGPSEPSNLFFFGLTSGAFSTSSRDFVSSSPYVSHYKIAHPYGAGAPEEFQYPKSGPWLLESPRFYLGSNPDDKPAPIHFHGLASIRHSLFSCPPLIFVKTSPYNEGLTLCRVIAGPLDGDNLDVNSVIFEVVTPDMTVGYNPTDISCYMTLPLSLFTQVINPQNLWVVGFDPHRESAVYTDPTSISVNSRLLYGDLGVLSCAGKILTSYHGNSVYTHEAPYKILSTAVGYAGRFRNHTGQGQSYGRLRNAGTVVVMNGSIYYGDTPDTIVWATPRYSDATMVRDDVQAVAVFRGEDAYSSTLSYGFWVVLYGISTSYRPMVKLLWSADGLSWELKGSYDIYTMVDDAFGAVPHIMADIRVNFSTTGLCIMGEVTSVQGSSWYRVKIINYGESALNTFSTYIDHPPYAFGEPVHFMDDSSEYFFYRVINNGTPVAYRLKYADNSVATLTAAIPQDNAAEIYDGAASLSANAALFDAVISSPMQGESLTTVPIGFIPAGDTPLLMRLTTNVLLPYYLGVSMYPCDTQNMAMQAPHIQVNDFVSTPTMGSVMLVSSLADTNVVREISPGVFSTEFSVPTCIQGSPFIVFSDHALTNGFDYNGGRTDTKRAPYSVLRLGFNAHCLYPHYPTSPALGGIPDIYLTDELANIRKLVASLVPTYEFRSAHLTAIDTSILFNFSNSTGGDGFLTPVVSSLSMGVTTGVPLSSSPTPLTPVLEDSKLPLGGKALVTDGSSRITLTGDLDSAFMNSNDCTIIDFAFTASVMGDSGCLLCITTAGGYYLEVWGSSEYLYLKACTPEQGLGNPVEVSIPCYATSGDVVNVMIVMVDSESFHTTSWSVNYCKEQMAGGFYSRGNPWYGTDGGALTGVYLMSHPTESGRNVTGTLEWFRVVTAFNNDPYVDLDWLSISRTHKPSVTGDFVATYHVTTPIVNDSLATGTAKHHLTITNTGDTWVASWCSGGNEYIPEGDFVIATSKDMLSWTVLSEADPIPTLSKVVTPMGFHPQNILPDPPIGSRGFLDYFTGVV